MPQTIRLLDVKQALGDHRFRARLPEHLLPEVEKYLRNPGCACNAPIYRRVLQDCAAQLREYFPGKSYESPSAEVARIGTNHWGVISCPIGELEARLRALPPGRKQVAIARWEDQVTVIINELDLLY